MNMQAILCTKYVSPSELEICEVASIVPRRGHVLIKVSAATVSSADWRISSLTVPKGFRFMMRLAMGWSGPRQPVLGSEFSGQVCALGEDSMRFSLGDQVFGFTDMAMGCHAQYVSLSQDGCLAIKPSRLSDAQAAALSFGGTTVLSFFRRADLKHGQSLLINGASGAVGTAAIQLAKHFGATVTAVCSSANMELVKSLGASHVIDYTRQDFTKNGKTYDVILDAAGTSPFSRCQPSLKANGHLLAVLADLPNMLAIPWLNLTRGQKIIAAPASPRPADIQLLGELAQRGEFTPHIDRIFSFSDVADAYRYVATGRKRGNVVISMLP
jgi:NADPH:quinone reductase-like Zn-dependent oxidoreductase